jgi:hypothetical protein
MKINIDHLSEAELLDLNLRTVERLRFLNQLPAHTQMLGFKLGDRVTFRPEGRPPVTGMLTRYNKKMASTGMSRPVSGASGRRGHPGRSQGHESKKKWGSW